MKSIEDHIKKDKELLDDPTLNPASPQFFDTEYAVIVFSGNKSADR